VALVAHQPQILHGKVIDLLHFPYKLECGEGVGLPLQLFAEGLHVVQVHMGVAHHVNEFACLEAAHVRHHVSKKGVARDIEGHSQAHVCGALIHLARKFSGLPFFVEMHEELAKHMAW